MPLTVEEKISHLQASVEHIVKAVVNNPEAVQTRLVPGEKITVLELKVDLTDIPNLIAVPQTDPQEADPGTLLDGIRALLEVAGLTFGHFVALQVIED